MQPLSGGSAIHRLINQRFFWTFSIDQHVRRNGTRSSTASLRCSIDAREKKRIFNCLVRIWTSKLNFLVRDKISFVGAQAKVLPVAHGGRSGSWVRYRYSYVWHDSESFMCVTRIIHINDMTHSYVWYDVWHDSFICVTWLRSGLSHPSWESEDKRGQWWFLFFSFFLSFFLGWWNPNSLLWTHQPPLLAHLTQWSSESRSTGAQPGHPSPGCMYRWWTCDLEIDSMNGLSTWRLTQWMAYWLRDWLNEWLVDLEIVWLVVLQIQERTRYYYYRVVPGHRNCQIETTVWNGAGFFTEGLEPRWQQFGQFLNDL